MKGILRALIKTIQAITYYAFTYVIPKDKNIWVFGSWKGRNFSDNSKELYLYMNFNHPEIRSVWIAKNDEVFEEVKKYGYEVKKYSSFLTKLLVSRAKVNIQTESNEDTGSYRVGGATIIQLFHGYGAVKEPLLFAGMNPLKKFLVKLYADNHSNSYWMVPAQYFVNRNPILYETNPDRTFITGQPRIDLLLNCNRIKYFEEIKLTHPQSKFIFYAPTHRNYAKNQKPYFDMSDWKSVDKFCKENGYILFFKPHPLELKYNLNCNRGLSNIFLLKDGMGDCPNDPYEYMHYFDLLISDYSSISTDFLLFDRPIIHFMYDLDTFTSEYNKLSGLNYFLAGPICRNWEEIFSEINKFFINDRYKKLRENVRNNAFKYRDNNNCQRVYNVINALINK